MQKLLGLLVVAIAGGMSLGSSIADEWGNEPPAVGQCAGSGCAAATCPCDMGNCCGGRGCGCGVCGKFAANRWFNCQCRGSYKFPVPPQYTYFWPGIYSQKTMTEYVSPYRFPPLQVPKDETGRDESAQRQLSIPSPQVAAAQAITRPYSKPATARIRYY